MSKQSLNQTTFIPFYESDVEKDRFYKTPKAFVEHDVYRLQMDSNMKLIYSILWDRYKLSLKNKWKDKNGVVYCIYARENLAHDLNISVSTVTKCIKKLVELNLMKEVRRGLNKPNLMYIGQVNSGLSKYTIQSSSNIRQNDTDLNETEKIKRHTIQENGVRVLSYYNQRYEEQFNKPHPTVTAEQLEELEYRLECNMTSNDFTEEKVMDMIDVHFEQLSPRNDGKIFSFLGNHELANPMIRYADDVEYG